MDRSRLFWRTLFQSTRARPSGIAPQSAQRLHHQRQQPWICTQCLHQRSAFKPSTAIRRNAPPRRHQSSTSTSKNPADVDPAFRSIVDNPPVLIRAGRRHNKAGLFILSAIPVISFFLGCWQVQRLGWKTELIARFEDRLVRDPLPLPPVVDPDAVKDFDYRRVVARGRLLHEKEMLMGPRLHDGEDGYLVITPLDRSDEFPSTAAATKATATILVNRGWIPKSKAAQSARDPSALPTGEVKVEGLLREPWKKNMFTPENRPEEGKWYFPDVQQMAEHVGSQAIWIEETMKPDLLVSYDREAKGVPIGRPAEVNLRNNHTQYIFTWFSLSLATSIMLWMVVKKPMGGAGRRIRQNKEW